MSFSLLKNISPPGRHFVICTRVSRLWEYRGGTDDGDIRHIDLVLVDAERTAIYAEITGENIKAKKSELAEGKVYTLRRFRVLKSKPAYRAVESQYMIDITCHTLIEEKHDVPAEFPRYVYTLTNFDVLPGLVGETRSFIDVIGLITEVSELSTIHLQHQAKPTVRRTITLRDDSNYEMKLYIWGKRASEFDATAVCVNGQEEPVIAIFVGTLMKTYKGEHSLSGNAACRWYINPDVPEAHALLNSLQGDFQPIQCVAEAEEQTVPTPQLPDPELKSLEEMLNISPYDFPRQGFRCIVTVSRIDPFMSWWFWSCNRCSKSCLLEGSTYRCPNCTCTGAKMKYKICVVATDGTDEAEFLFFGDIGRRLVRKDVKSLVRSVRRADDMPSEIAALVSQKFQLAVNVTSKSFEKPQRSYEVKSINCVYGRQRTIPTIKKSIEPSDTKKRKATALHGGSSSQQLQSTDEQIQLPSSSQAADATPPPKNSLTSLGAPTELSALTIKQHAGASNTRRRLFKNKQFRKTAYDDTATADLDEELENITASDETSLASDDGGNDGSPKDL